MPSFRFLAEGRELVAAGLLPEVLLAGGRTTGIAPLRPRLPLPLAFALILNLSCDRASRIVVTLVHDRQLRYLRLLL